MLLRIKGDAIFSYLSHVLILNELPRECYLSRLIFRIFLLYSQNEGCIYLILSGNKHPPSHPARGAWIETNFHIFILDGRMVAPHTGYEVEITLSKYINFELLLLSPNKVFKLKNRLGILTKNLTSF